jgi:UDP-N-acetylglucosamine--N-acetylmuramyl-(pentapeptide) pyrophosphoryl-undecaprenol N-acetylglucosamine transferase
VVVFSGGGTGGHLYPALALADAVRELRPDVRAVFVGAARGVEARVLPERGEEHLLLPVRGFQRGRGLANWRALPALGRSLARVAGLFRRRAPEVVVVTGGYAGGPAGMAAGAFRVPLVLQEQNAVPGVTTRVLARWAERVHLAFPEAAEHLPEGARGRARTTGNPVRPVLAVSREEARAAFGLPAEGDLVLVVGGSQGSRALNRALEEAVASVARGDAPRPDGLHLLWSTGPAHADEVRAALRGAGDPGWVRAVAYIDDMPAALAAADLAVSRAGAMATAEILNQGLPAVLVPLPTAAADHQRRNARALEEAGAAFLVEEEGLTGPALWSRVTSLLGDGEARAAMAEAARRRSRPDAARVIATDIVSFLPGPGGTR